MSKVADTPVLPRPVELLPDYANATARKNLGEKLVEPVDLGEVKAMRAVMGEHIVLALEQERKGGGNRLLTDTEVHRAPHLVGRMVFADEGFLAPPQPEHLTIKLEADFGGDPIE